MLSSCFRKKNESIRQFKKGMMRLIKYLPAYGNVNMEINLGNIEILIKSLTDDSSTNINVL